METDKIVELRKRKGLTQERLSEIANINLRTLQRIEKGETIPRGHTLQALARALDVPITELTELNVKKDPSFIKVLTLSALAFWVFPFGNILAPYVLWLMKRDTIDGVYEAGKRLINSQIIWSSIVYGLLIVAVLGSVLLSFQPVLLLCTVALMLLLAIANSVMILIQAFRADGPHAATA